MAAIILAGKEASAEELARALAEAQKMSECDIAVIADCMPEGASLFYSTSQASFATALAQAVENCDEENIILLDARLTLSPSMLQGFADFCKSKASDAVSYVALEAKHEILEINDFAVESVVNAIAARSTLPLYCIGFSKHAFESHIASQSQSAAELMAEMMLHALVRGSEIAEFAEPVHSNSVPLLSDEAYARLLATAMNHINIEELFPQHDWSGHQSESAAASYHALAALFIKLGDVSSASECLKLSDNFEDSPRSQALKGIIASQRGEMLGAVANMVTSLQQYETRKKSVQGSHYLSFAPQDIEVVSNRLQEGLAALNVRDNKSAYEHFREAVFNFDAFFKDLGIEK